MTTMDRGELLASIAATVKDYRKGELEAPTPQHVNTWVCQFDEAVQRPILAEMHHVLQQTYFSRKRTETFLANLSKTRKLVGEDPTTFWKSTRFFDTQSQGQSQKELLQMFDSILKQEFDIGLSDCGANPQSFLYIDDAAFTGNRIRWDLEEWVKSIDVPSSVTVHIVVMARHTFSEYAVSKAIEAAAKEAGKHVDLKWWSGMTLENRKGGNNQFLRESDVLRPVMMLDDADVSAYMSTLKESPVWRPAGSSGGRGIFSSDTGRQLLENEFLKAGVRIRNMSSNLKPSHRPLGYDYHEYSVGFGSLIITFRNCPNTTPLALWANGDGQWYPLFPRSGNVS